MKRVAEAVVAALLLALMSPVILLILLLVWLEDRKFPLFRSERVGLRGEPFTMLKVRTMFPQADRTMMDSTAADDIRLTRIGTIIRRYKIDELPQLWNVVRGQMSIVGPRPNVRREVALYTAEERLLLTVRPGITDLASIVFSDLAEILRGQPDANIAYNQLVRPWKSRLGLLYVEHSCVRLDTAIVAITALNALSRRRALEAVGWLVKKLGAPTDLWRVARRLVALAPTAPPGSTELVTSRD